MALPATEVIAVETTASTSVNAGRGRLRDFMPGFYARAPQGSRFARPLQLKRRASDCWAAKKQ